MTDQEFAALKARVDADDPVAMFVYADMVRAQNPQEAYKYTVLAAQLGNPNAAERLGDKYMESGDNYNASHYYRMGAKADLLDCAVKLAVINLTSDETAALRDLEELAESGVKSACYALAAYYKARGNKKESDFWASIVKE